jgi:hypothetical protein
MSEHWKKVLTDYAEKDGNRLVTREAMDRAVDALAERMYEDYDHYRDALTREASYAQQEKELEAMREV